MHSVRPVPRTMQSYSSSMVSFLQDTTSVRHLVFIQDSPGLWFVELLTSWGLRYTITSCQDLLGFEGRINSRLWLPDGKNQRPTRRVRISDGLKVIVVSNWIYSSFKRHHLSWKEWFRNKTPLQLDKLNTPGYLCNINSIRSHNKLLEVWTKYFLTFCLEVRLFITYILSLVTTDSADRILWYFS